MTAWPDPDPGIPWNPVRVLVEHQLAGGGHVAEVIGRPRLDTRLTWSGLTATETASIEQYTHGSCGPGPFLLILDGAPGWNFLHPLLAAASSTTGDTSGWTYDGSTTLTSVTTPVLRGPRALQWTVPASGSDRWMWPDYPVVPDTLPLGVTGTGWTFGFNARTLTDTATLFAQLYDSTTTTDGPDTTVGTTWTTVSVTHTPTPGETVMPFIGKRPGPAADIVLDTPRLSAGTTLQPWTPGRGIPQVVIAEASITARWHDLYDITATLREVGR